MYHTSEHSTDICHEHEAALEVSNKSGLLSLPKEEAGDECDLAKAKMKQLFDYIAQSMKILLDSQCDT